MLFATTAEEQLPLAAAPPIRSCNSSGSNPLVSPLYHPPTPTLKIHARTKTRHSGQQTAQNNRLPLPAAYVGASAGDGAAAVVGPAATPPWPGMGSPGLRPDWSAWCAVE